MEVWGLAPSRLRTYFTVSERAEIGKALEVELQGRVGNPALKSIPENFPELPKGDTRDLAAKAAGFGNGKTYEQAKMVVDAGVPELVAAMNAGAASVSAAAAVAALPPEEQREVLQQGRFKEVARAARHVGRPKKGAKADSIREELKAVQARGDSMLCVNARQLLRCIRDAEGFSGQERELLIEVASAIQATVDEGVLQ